ncbi:hypothetical protein [Thalassotalea sp. PLHSN55]|uniref:hypothetical protein n=1 Tax=Thalassotalea sp. PLHSN55 TaxID=3435888 RepID=UPI003F874436
MIKFLPTKKVVALVFTTLLTLPTAFAESELLINIPKVPDAEVFAEFTDKLPAVVNYFSSESEQAIISFYQAVYGEAISSDRKRGRLTLYFSNNEIVTRVVISQQNNKRQVDVLVENSQ